ncbi:MAG: ATP-grasp domain-containing protein [Treponema sp.]|nr:ATP-grasp domain-containing protein [Treponema sp.]
MKKNILILGAGFLQKPAVTAAKKLGYNTVVVDADPDAVCIPLADRFVPVDLKDKEGIYTLAQKLNADGGLASVFTAGTDFSASVSFAGEKLGLPCHTYEAALNASNKTRMRACFTESGVPSPSFFRVTKSDIENGVIHALVAKLGFPCVIKPADNMGARGCRMIRRDEEVEEAAFAAVSNSRTETAVVEQYMDGPEYSIDALISGGTMTITGFADRHIYYPPYFIETGHTMPTGVEPLKRSELIAVFALGVKALGLTCGAAKADIKYTGKGPMIGEIAARLSGGYMSGWTYPYASGCNLTEQALLIACGQKPVYLEQHRIPVKFEPPVSCRGQQAPFELYEVLSAETSAERAWISIPGVVSDVIGIDHAASVAGVKNVFPRSQRGTHVDFPRNNVQKCGNVIALAGERGDAVAAAEKAVSSIVVRLEPACVETEEFLSENTGKNEKGFPPPAYIVLCDTDKISGIIPQGRLVSGVVPHELLTLFMSDDAEDWNYRTLRQTCALFDALCPDHPALDARSFWNAVVRGGIQGALYVSDTASGART